MKKLFLLIMICITFVVLTNISFIKVNALSQDEMQFTKEIKQQTDELSKLNEFLEIGKHYDDFENKYGGAFFENNLITINIVKNDDKLVDAMGFNGLFNIKMVNHSQRELDLAIEILEANMTELSIDSITRSIRQNTLIITVVDNYAENVKAIKELTGFDDLIIENKQLDYKAMVGYVINGKELYFNTSTPGSCTSGFAALNSNGNPGVVTAGHCVSSSYSVNGTDVYYNGTHVGDVGGTTTWKFSGSTDAAFIKLRDPWIGTTWLPTREFMNGDTYHAASAPSSYLVEGVTVFMYGYKSGMLSGEIISTYATVFVDGVSLTNAVITDILVIKGDSGAALTTWVYAGGATALHMVMGVLSGGNSTSSCYTTVDHIFSDLNLSNY